MSYEGFIERLCRNGHYWAVDAYAADDSLSCARCGFPGVWEHSVDQTNGELEMEDGSIHPDTTCFPLEVDHYEERVIQVPIYKVPQRGTGE